MEIKAVQLFNDIDIFERKLMEMLRPVGSLYWTSKSPEDGGDPNELFIGTWVRIVDNYIYAADDTDTVDNTSIGADEITLTTANLPKHTHGMNGHTHGFSVSINDSGDGGFGLNHLEGAHSSYNLDTYGYVTRVTYNKSSARGSRIQVTNGDAELDVDFTHSHGHTFSVGAPNVNDTSDGGFENGAFSIIPDHINRYCWERIE